jgi:Uma2 family endonuclease
MPISFETYQRVALEDPEGKWELDCGRLREKPPMTVRHGRTTRRLNAMLVHQLDWREWSVGGTRLRVTSETYFVPDLTVLPESLVLTLDDDQFEVYSQPVPLVVEVWSPSTGEYDVDTKFPEYRLRGDLEIWRLHPYEETLTTWRRQPDGTYQEVLLRGGTVRPVAIPGVSINLDELFA